MSCSRADQKHRTYNEQVQTRKNALGWLYVTPKSCPIFFLHLIELGFNKCLLCVYYVQNTHWILSHALSHNMRFTLLMILMKERNIKQVAPAAKLLQSCPTLCNPIDGSPPGSPVPGILQAGTLEWVAISFSNAWKWKVKVKSPSRVRLVKTPWTAAYQAPPSMGFSRQEYWSGLPLPSPIKQVKLHKKITHVMSNREIFKPVF